MESNNVENVNAESTNEGSTVELRRTAGEGSVSTHECIKGTSAVFGICNNANCCVSNKPTLDAAKEVVKQEEESRDEVEAITDTLSKYEITINGKRDMGCCRGGDTPTFTSPAFTLPTYGTREVKEFSKSLVKYSMRTMVIITSNAELREMYKKLIADVKERNDAGMDLIIPKHYNIPAGICCEVNKTQHMIDHEVSVLFFDKFGFSVDYKTNPRSSISKCPCRQSNSIGTIDELYTGNLMTPVDNFMELLSGYETDEIINMQRKSLQDPNFVGWRLIESYDKSYIHLTKGFSINQVEIPRCIRKRGHHFEVIIAESSSYTTKRGAGGFGSTNK
jgi:dUTPase